MTGALVILALQWGTHALLLAGTAGLAETWVHPFRLIAASCLGAAYTLACLQPGLGVMAGWTWHLGCLLAEGVVAFGWDGKAVGAFALLTMALGDAVLAAGRGGVWQLPLYALGVQMLGKLAFSSRSRRIMPLCILEKGISLSVNALYDTGNELRDPVTGDSVLVVDAGAAGKLTGLTPFQLEHPLETVVSAPVPGLRLIPYETVGNRNGIMLGKIFTIRTGKKSRRGLVAFAPQNFGSDYQALTGGFVYEKMASGMATKNASALLHRWQ